MQEGYLLMAASIQAPQVLKAGCHHLAITIGRAFQRVVVDDQKFSFNRKHIQLDPGTAHGDCQTEGTQGVFRFVATGTTVSDAEESRHITNIHRLDGDSNGFGMGLSTD